MPTKSPLVPIVDKTVAQHNALINARFSFVPLEMRLFISLLTRIEPGDEQFREHFVPMAEIIHERTGGSAYDEVKQMCNNITSRRLYIEKLIDTQQGTRKRSKKPDFEFIPLMAKAAYESDRGGVVASFNPLIMPYLLQLRESGNFTLAQLEQLNKLKSFYSYRIYWLLKEYATFKERTITIAQLRFLLDLQEGEYPRFNNLRTRILDKAQTEMQQTDMPFTYELQKQGKVVSEVKFLLAAPHDGEVMPTKSPLAEVPAWARTLAEIGVGERSLAVVHRQLEAGEYEVDYIAYVIRIVTNQFRKGKIKKPAGAIYKALIEKYLLVDYQQAKAAAGTKKKALTQAPSAAATVTYRLSEVRKMYDNPGPYAQRQKQADTFEQHLQQVYLRDGFTIEDRDGEQWLVKYDEKR
ncbi:replication initiation protein [Hymenobacter sublimis]|uniref:Replication initiation protein n=1 Tax=Hymenobacter sublimis TaxID=2933777 RepID=A0ABY4JJC7_9BACT|nr:replication initiation protein [Hymenobacter sublimis]UPL51404.1 replication initiation protein [Hymenobacter sublimis]